VSGEKMKMPRGGQDSNLLGKSGFRASHSQAPMPPNVEM